MMGVEDARMTSIKRERSGGVKISQELMNALFLVKTFQIYERSPLDASVEVKKGGYIKVSQVVSLNTVSRQWHPYCLQVALCLHLESPLSQFPPHSMACLRSDHRVGPGFLMCRRDRCAC